MLELKELSKQYKTGGLVQNALDGVSLTLRDREFVAILGPSGSGKTTLLNMIGGLDRWDGGEMRIDGISTRSYSVRDWDAYRCHKVGFVFQNYSLIPHQSVEANVELALTIVGLSPSQRRERVRQALNSVGLADHAGKRPNQLSGGQMQRVAIARALVNNPSILLADEPTGALDSVTSVQIMELLKEISKTKLVVLVTHNNELAQRYASRIIRLRDGRILEDTNPWTEPQAETAPTRQGFRWVGMSFGTALGLSLSNLMTKKARTLLTAFAGSIGIISIALVLSISNGVNAYIDETQRAALADYPLSINDVCYSGSLFSDIEDGSDSLPNDGKIYADTSYGSSTAQSFTLHSNDLTAFRAYLEGEDCPLKPYLGENGVVYSYPLRYDLYAVDATGEVRNTTDAPPVELQTEPEEGETEGEEEMDEPLAPADRLLGSARTASAMVQILPTDREGKLTRAVRENYTLLYGDYPQEADEVLLLLRSPNALSATTLYQLGLLTEQEYLALNSGSETDLSGWTLEELCGASLYLTAPGDYFVRQEDGLYTRCTTYAEVDTVLAQSLPLRVSGILCFNEGVQKMPLTATVLAAPQLTEYLIAHSQQSGAVLAQRADPTTNILTGETIEEESGMYQNILNTLGELHADKPSTVSLYAAGFEARMQIQACIDAYNADKPEEEQLVYQDYAAQMTGSVSSIIQIVTYVLVAFGGVSLLVAGIMIGIITHISVMERTREIGILRALGASRGDVALVFHAETFLTGLLSGLLGVGAALLVRLPVLVVLRSAAGLPTLQAILKPEQALVLVLTSVAVTVLGGLLPAWRASHKNPVAALRTE